MLAEPTPSGSADAPRLCRGCSHPHRHLPDPAAPSFCRLLRQPTGAGLSPPLKQQRLTAHEASTERVRHHLRRPDPPGRMNQPMDQIRSTVHLTDPSPQDARQAVEQGRHVVAGHDGPDDCDPMGSGVGQRQGSPWVSVVVARVAVTVVPPKAAGRRVQSQRAMSLYDCVRPWIARSTTTATPSVTSAHTVSNPWSRRDGGNPEGDVPVAQAGRRPGGERRPISSMGGAATW